MVDYRLDYANPLGAYFAGYGRQRELDALDRKEKRAQRLDDLQIRRGEQDLLAAQQAYGITEQMAPVQIAQAGANVEATQLQNQAREQQLSQAERQDRYRARTAELAMDGGLSIEDVDALNKEFPELAAATAESFDAMSGPAKRAAGGVLVQSIGLLRAGNVDAAETILTDYADALEAEGDEAGALTVRASMDVMKSDPQAAALTMGIVLRSLDPELARDVLGSGRDTSTNVQSTKEIGQFLTEQTRRDGSIVYIDRRTGQQVPLADQERVIEESLAAEREQRGGIKEAEALGDLSARAELGESAEAAEAVGGIRGGMIEGGIEQASAISGSISTIDRAIAAIDNGADLGFFRNRLPAFDAETAEARAALNQMGLDVVGSVTFGALSEGELRIAMETARPQNLEGPEMREWLVRRRAALEQIQAAINDRNAFLLDPENSLADWVALRSGQGSPASTDAPRAPANAPSYLDRY